MILSVACLFNHVQAYTILAFCSVTIAVLVGENLADPSYLLQSLQGICWRRKILLWIHHAAYWFLFVIPACLEHGSR